MKRNFFRWVTNNPIKIAISAVLVTVFFVTGVLKIVKDTSADAFIDDNHPALVNKEKLSKIFGLEDPMVVVIENKNGVYTPETIELLYKLSEDIQEFKEIKNDGITSLSTQKNIYGSDNEMFVTPFVEQKEVSLKEAKEIERHFDNFTMLHGVLVSNDKKSTLIIAELKNGNDAEVVYKKLLEVAKKHENSNIKIYVAGEGAVSGYMGAYIDHDAKRLNPIAALTIMIILYVAFRRIGAVLLPNIVIAGAVVTALGSMGMSSIPFFVITNALPVVLIGISVADSIHILSTYYERRRDFPSELQKQSVIETMLEMWSPIGLTTLTTMAGFLGLSLSSSMPPMIYFGLFAMLGVGVAWLYSVTVLPALMTLFKLKESSMFVKEENKVSNFEEFGLFVADRPKTVLFSALIIAIVGILGISSLKINEDRITTFHSDEPIVKADTLINSSFNGSHYLDILVDSFEEDALFNLEVMKQVEKLQHYVKSIPHVNSSIAYTDYLKQMNLSLNGNEESEYRLPPSSEAAAQFFLLYSARAAADDFENILDYDYRQANIRIYIDSGEYIDEKLIIKNIENYINDHFNSENLQAKVSGRVNVDYYWVLAIEESHLLSVAISLLLVFLMGWLTFRSLFLALLVVVPILLSIIMIYGVMGYTDIWLGVGTSMFASIAIGLGVDFAVHTTQKMYSLEKINIKQQAIKLYNSTGRALFFNALALALGFGILVTSKVVPLVKFGSLVAVAIGSSFIFSLLIIPAAMILIHKDK